MSIDLIKDTGFKAWLADLKTRIRQSQIKAMIKVNDEMLRLYWDLGHDIVIRQMDAEWGSGFYKNLSKELKDEFPDMQGFSVTNLKYCKYFYQFYSQDKQIRPQLGNELQIPGSKSTINRQQVVDDFATNPLFLIPWGHHMCIIDKCKSVREALFYVQKTIKNGWSRAMLSNFIDVAIGLLICKTKDNIEAKYSLESSSQPIGISAYNLSKLIPENLKSSLPSIEDIERELNKHKEEK